MSLTAADGGRVESVDAAMIQGPTGEVDTCDNSLPSGSLIEINDKQCNGRQCNLRSWLVKGIGRAVVEKEGSWK
jgi:hypothetical protein